MKKLLFTFFCAVFFTSAFAIKVVTEVTGVYAGDDGVNCCYKMIHLYYTDDGHFMGYGFSESGNCCPNPGINVTTTGLSAEHVVEVQAFSSTEVFVNSINDAILKYETTNGLGFNHSDAPPVTPIRKVLETFYFPSHGTGELVMVQN